MLRARALKLQKRKWSATVGAVQTRPVQIRLATTNTSETYVTEEGWRKASLKSCPNHPEGGCGFARHGTYPRVEPPGVKVARWYCARSQMTFSLLPDCLAVRLSGSLHEVEQVVVAVELGTSIEAAAAKLRPDITLPSALRWTRRRIVPVRAAMLAIVTLFPLDFAGAHPTVLDLRRCLGRPDVLVALRGHERMQLSHVSYPLGFCHPTDRRDQRPNPSQHETGPDTRVGPR